MSQFILGLRSTMDLNFLVTLFLQDIPQKGRVSPIVILTSSLQREILSTLSEGKILKCRPSISSGAGETILSLINLSDACP